MVITWILCRVLLSLAASPIIYYLSVSCLEYFIARKIRSVFDVYRQVFHQSVAEVKIKNISNRKSESISSESMKRNIRMMHEQLFANLENLNMLFSPVFLQVSSFVWDDTRSVRSNIYGFIDSYYKVALGSARLLKENKCNDDNLINIMQNLKDEVTVYKDRYNDQCYLTDQWKSMFYIIMEELKRK